MKDAGCWAHRQRGQQTEPVQQQGMHHEVAFAIMQPQDPAPTPMDNNEVVTLAAIAGAASPMRSASIPMQHAPPPIESP